MQRFRRSPGRADVRAWAASPLLGGELELKADASELTAARRFAEEAGERFGLEERERYEVTFAVNEAVSNAIEHGRASREGTIRLRVADEGRALVFYVEDHGVFKPKAPAVDPFPERGRGLAFMAAMVDEVDVRSGEHGTVVRLCKQRPSA
jgi:serine/threonine-protein kinase RsbW